MNRPLIGTPVYVALTILLLLPFGLGAAMVMSRQIYNPAMRWGAYEFAWLMFGLIFVIAASAQQSSPLTPLKNLSRADIAAILIVFLGLLLSSIFFAPYPSFAMLYGMSAPLALLVGAASVQLAKNLGLVYSRAVCVSLFAGIVLHAVVIALLQVITFGMETSDWVQLAAPGFLNFRHYAFSLEVGIAVGVGLLLSSPNGLSKLLVFVGISILWSLLFWTGARGAIMALFVSLVFTSAILPRAFKTFSLTATASAVCGVFLSLLFHLPDDRFGVFKLAARSTDVQSVNQLSSSRISMWSEAIELIRNNPLFGYGPGQFSFLSTFKTNLHPHNSLLDIFLSIGVICGGFLIYLLLKMWFSAAKRTIQNHPPLKIAIFWAVNALIIHSMLAGSLFLIHSRLIFAILIGILVAETMSKSTDKIS